MLEEAKLAKAKFIAKPKEKLSPKTPLIFNRCILTQEDNNIALHQREQGKKLQTIDIDLSKAEMHKSYIIQRACKVYIASIYQLEATFDILVVAQHQEPSKDKVVALNKRLKWQMENIDQGLIYIPLDLSTAKLYIFVDRSFANNKDFSF